jgi:hypothetical protein
MVRRLLGGGLQKVPQRLKPVLSTPVETSNDDLNGDMTGQHKLPINGPKKKKGQQNSTRRRPPDGSDQPDGSVVSSYQPLADLDLDDDAIMV